MGGFILYTWVKRKWILVSTDQREWFDSSLNFDIEHVFNRNRAIRSDYWVGGHFSLIFSSRWDYVIILVLTLILKYKVYFLINGISESTVKYSVYLFLYTPSVYLISVSFLIVSHQAVTKCSEHMVALL